MQEMKGKAPIHPTKIHVTVYPQFSVVFRRMTVRPSYHAYYNRRLEDFAWYTCFKPGNDKGL